MNIYKKLIAGLFIFGFGIFPNVIFAEDIVNFNAPTLQPKSELFITPRSGNFLVGSTFEAPIYIDTKGNNINAINLKISFDPNKLTIVKPSSGKSIFGIWIETPGYDNVKGTASLVGVIPGGIVTSSGLIGTITFKAKASGSTRVNITNYSSANLNDGLGSEVELTRIGATYTIDQKPPEGMTISSETHPSQDRWYNNNNPILNWSIEDGNIGYSITFDNSPNTIPPNEINSTESSKAYENIKDGIWYFHVKANKNGVWGNTSNFQVKIDTTAPAVFTPNVNTIKDNGKNKKYLVSFLTTDSLSGINHYEVGIINKKEADTMSPVFTETESPYLIPLDTSNNLRVIIRAFDNAGNLHDASVDLYPGYNLISILKDYSMYILSLLIILMLLELTLHYLFGHHVLSNFKKAYDYFKNIPEKETKKILISEEKINPIPLIKKEEKDELPVILKEEIITTEEVNKNPTIKPEEKNTELEKKLEEKVDKMTLNSIKIENLSEENIDNE
jgi:hypothetical protein